MFIPNVPKVYIADPAEMEIGMDLWHVGQGGITVPNRPYYKGTLAVLDHRRDINNNYTPDAGFFVSLYPEKDWLRDGRKLYSDNSYKDCHIMAQQYNNWYMCSSEEAANTIYQFIKNIWETDPKYEAERERFDAQKRRWDWFD